MVGQDNRIRFGVFELDPRSRELRKGGVRIKLEDQPFEVLMILIEKRGEIVTRAELRARIWPEGTFVDFDRSLTKAINKIRAALGDSAISPRFIETRCRHGYRFIAPLHLTDLPAPACPAGRSVRGLRPSATRAWMVAAATGVVLVALTLAGLVHWFSVPGPSSAIVVLPVKNLTGDPALEFIADDVTDEVIARLARNSRLRVVSRTSSMHYKDTQKTLPQIAKELQVDAVMESSMRVSGSRIRINVRLLHVSIERQVWSDVFEEDRAEIGKLPPRIAKEIEASGARARPIAGEGARATLKSAIV